MTQMARVVPAGLLYFIRELYLDDIKVFGSSENDFCDNLRMILLRLDKFGIISKPPKNFIWF